MREYAYGLFNNQLVVGELDDHGHINDGYSIYALNVMKYEKPLPKGVKVPVKFRHNGGAVQSGVLTISYGKPRIISENDGYYKTQECIMYEA